MSSLNITYIISMYHIVFRIQKEEHILQKNDILINASKIEKQRISSV